MTSNCPLCQGTLLPWITTPIDAKTEATIEFGRLVRCSQCSFGMVHPRPTPDAIAQSYDLPNYYTHGQSHFADGEPRTLLDRIRFHLAWRLDYGESLTADMVHKRAGGRRSTISDVGCGSGELAGELSRLRHDVVGIEIDERAVQLARKNGVDVYQGSIEQLPAALAGRQFDMVILSHVLEHVLDPIAAIRTVRELLRPGGRLICEVPNNAAMGLNYSGAAWEPLDVPRHLNFFVPQNLHAICSIAELKPVDFFFSGYCRQFSNEWIATEARIYDAIAQQPNRAMPRPRRNSNVRAWRLLARTALSRRSSKYDSVGIVAER